MGSKNLFDFLIIHEFRSLLWSIPQTQTSPHQSQHRNYTMHSKSSHNNKRSTGTSTCSDSGLTREQHEQEHNVRQASRTPTAAFVGPPTQLETYVLQNVVSIDGSVGVGKSTVLDTILSSEQLPYVLALCTSLVTWARHHRQSTTLLTMSDAPHPTSYTILSLTDTVEDDCTMHATSSLQRDARTHTERTDPS